MSIRHHTVTLGHVNIIFGVSKNVLLRARGTKVPGSDRAVVTIRRERIECPVSQNIHKYSPQKSKHPNTPEVDVDMYYVGYTHIEC